MASSDLHTSVRRTFAGRTRTFELLIDEMGELERLCDAGIGAIFMRLSAGAFHVADVRETIRLGLIGGGLPGPDADALVMAAFDRQPLQRFLQLAFDILAAMINGLPQEDEAQKKTADAAPDAMTSESPATSPPSTKPEASSASAPEPSGA